jgi:hypothetical protein
VAAGAGPGTYRVVDGARVEFADARAAWTEPAREHLIAVARSYNAMTTYRELAEDVQVRSGIRTKMLPWHWIGGVLGDVARDCHRRDEPLLSALCVHSDGTVGKGYALATRENYGIDPSDPDLHAAEERLRCYRHFGAVLPADGGRPQLPGKLASRRERARRRPMPETRRAPCPTCFVELPISGECGNCS